MTRYFIHLAYNGKDYHGWQVQPNAHTVQAEINKCFSKFLRQPINVVGCGRTDTGVHARDFFAHMELEQPLENLDAVAFRLNRFLPSDIVLFSIFEVDAELHTRFSATQRTYHYQITTQKDPFRTHSHWYVHADLDLDKMNRAASILKEYTDFSCFSKSRTDTNTNICQLSETKWQENGTELVFVIAADRFLRNMVRAIVGTMIDVGTGKLTVEAVHGVLQSKDRGEAGQSVPGHGLYLHQVDYPETLNAYRAK